MKEDMTRTIPTCEAFFPFTEEELREALKHLKMSKTSGLDGISTETIKHFSPKTFGFELL